MLAVLVGLTGCRAFEVRGDGDSEGGNAPVRDAGPRTASLGTPVTVDGLQITFEDAKYSKGFRYQEPARGHLFVAYEVALLAIEGDHLVTSADFTVSADGTRQGRSTIVVADQWDPSLNFEDLKEGHEIGGWIVFEVPEPDEYLELSYDKSIFSDGPDIVLRIRCCR